MKLYQANFERISRISSPPTLNGARETPLRPTIKRFAKSERWHNNSDRVTALKLDWSIAAVGKWRRSLEEKGLIRRSPQCKMYLAVVELDTELSGYDAGHWT